jgi:hypothetical protein
MDIDNSDMTFEEQLKLIRESNYGYSQEKQQIKRREETYKKAMRIFLVDGCLPDGVRFLGSEVDA